MDAITAMVDAEHDRLTKEIRECVKSTDKGSLDDEEFVKTRQNLIEERDDIEGWMAELAIAGDTANVLPRDFLKAIVVYPGKLL